MDPERYRNRWLTDTEHLKTLKQYRIEDKLYFSDGFYYFIWWLFLIFRRFFLEGVIFILVVFIFILVVFWIFRDFFYSGGFLVGWFQNPLGEPWLI